MRAVWLVLLLAVRSGFGAEPAPACITVRINLTARTGTMDSWLKMIDPAHDVTLTFDFNTQYWEKPYWSGIDQSLHGYLDEIRNGGTVWRNQDYAVMAHLNRHIPPPSLGALEDAPRTETIQLQTSGAPGFPLNSADATIRWTLRGTYYNSGVNWFGDVWPLRAWASRVAEFRDRKGNLSGVVTSIAGRSGTCEPAAGVDASETKNELRTDPLFGSDGDIARTIYFSDKRSAGELVAAMAKGYRIDPESFADAGKAGAVDPRAWLADQDEQRVKLAKWATVTGGTGLATRLLDVIVGRRRARERLRLLATLLHRSNDWDTALRDLAKRTGITVPADSCGGANPPPAVDRQQAELCRESHLFYSLFGGATMPYGQDFREFFEAGNLLSAKTREEQHRFLENAVPILASTLLAESAKSDFGERYDLLLYLKGAFSELGRLAAPLSKQEQDPRLPSSLRELRAKVAELQAKGEPIPTKTSRDLADAERSAIGMLDRPNYTLGYVVSRHIYQTVRWPTSSDAFIDIYRHMKFDEATNGKAVWIYSAIVMTNLNTVISSIGDGDRIDRIASTWIASAVSDRNAQADPVTAQAWEELKANVWGRIREIANVAGTMWLCPDGILNLLPWQVFDDHKMAIVFSPYDRIARSVAGWYMPGVKRAGSAPWGFGVVADLNYGRNPEGEDRFPPLRWSKYELDFVQELANRTGLPLEGLTQEQATRTAFDALARKYAFVVVSTHGFLRARNLDFQPGIALSRANDPHATDALLSADEIASMDLSGADVVVFSSCEGTGAIQSSGQGVAGLASAALRAGAKSVLVSTWQVDDEATAALVTEFLQQAILGKPKAEALRLAQQRTRERFPGQYYWAGWQLVGDGEIH
jgi:hypothetical protein